MASKIALAGLLVPLASALGFPGSVRGPGYVSVPVLGRVPDAPLRRRDTTKTDDIEMPTFGGNSGWVVNITIGTPGQMTSVSIDTGSTELWVDPDCSKAGTVTNETNANDSGITVVNDPLHDPALCTARGRYDPSKSSTSDASDIAGKKFTYGDSTTVYVNYYQDDINFGSITIEDQIFGVANVSNQTGIGIMGMGPPPFGFNNSGFYPLILTTMASQGAINSPAFSLDLRDLGNTTGTLIFGGVDKGKYGGPLTKIPVETVTRKFGGASFNDYSTYYLQVNSLTLLSPNNTKDQKSLSIPSGGFVGGLDCGSGAMLMPAGVTSSICTDLNGTVSEAAGGSCIVDCSVRGLSGGLKLSLNGKDVTIGYPNLVMQYGDGDSALCTLGMQDSPFTTYDPPIYLLGAPFLRAVYAVFDWGNEAVHLAEPASCGTNIVAIGNGTSAVPGGNGDCASSPASMSVANTGLIAAAALFSLMVLM